MSTADIKQQSNGQMQIDKNVTLQVLLQNQNLALFQLLSIKNIQTKIRSDFSYFIRYCQKNQQFCFNLIDIGIKCPMHEGSSENMKNVCYIAADILTCDQDIIADLLILPDKLRPVKKDSGDESDQFQQIQENIETQLQTQKITPLTQDQQPLNAQEKFYKRYRNLIKLLQYVELNETKNLDQNCINYMIKSLNCLLRKKSQQLLEFLQKKQTLLKRLIELNQFSSINQFFIKILSDDELSGENIFKIKRQIIGGVLKNIKDSLNKQDFVERLDFLEQLFQTNKYSAEDERTELQKLSDVFVSRETIHFYYNSFINPLNDLQFYNSTTYLTTMIKRMNVDEELDPYSYTNEPKQQTMHFEMEILFREFPKILQKGHQNLMQNLICLQDYKKRLMQTKYFEFLVSLTKNSRFVNCDDKQKTEQFQSGTKQNNKIFSSRHQKIQQLKQLIKKFIGQSKSGINRNYLMTIFEKILSMQIYCDSNHSQLSPAQQGKKSSVKNQTQEHKDQLSNQNGPEKSQTVNVSEQKVALDAKAESNEDKKNKISKIRAGLKLNIKKFSAQSSQKPAEQIKKDPKKEQQLDIKKLQSSLNREEVIQILEQFSDLLNQNVQIQQQQAKCLKQNKETELGAMINKIIMILCNSVWWSNCLTKDEFVSKVQSLFPVFSFKDICLVYSITLATNKHPNANAKSKTHPELCFCQDFFKIYGSSYLCKDNLKKQNQPKSSQLNESDYLSEEDQQGTKAIKCTLDGLKKFTGFKFSTNQKPQWESRKVDNLNSQKLVQTKTNQTKAGQTNTGQTKTDENKTEQTKIYYTKTDLQVNEHTEIQKANEQHPNDGLEKTNLTELDPKNLQIAGQDTTQKKSEEHKRETNKKQKQQKGSTGKQQVQNPAFDKNKSKDQQIRVVKIPLQFYIKHAFIYV